MTTENTEKIEPIFETVNELPTGVDQLGAIIPTARGRKIAYAIYAAAALAVGNTAVGFAAVSVEQPAWLIVASAVIANLAAPFSALAIANAKK